MFEDIEKKLEEFSDEGRRAIIKAWRRIITPELKNLSKRLNPFAGKAKPKPKTIFSAQPSKKKGAVTIWGVHPNISADPVWYPSIPPEGFLEVQPFPVRFKGGAYREVSRAQKHMKRMPRNIYNKSVQLHEFFTFESRVYGIQVGTTNAIPAYSERSLPEMVKDYDGMEDLIRETFEKAVKEVAR